MNERRGASRLVGLEKSARRTARLAWVFVAPSLVGCPSVTTLDDSGTHTPDASTLDAAATDAHVATSDAPHLPDAGVPETAAPSTPGLTVTMSTDIRPWDDDEWIDRPEMGNWYYARGHADASCAAGAAVEYRWLYAYTGEATPTEWTEWRRSSEALVVRPIPPYGVRMWVQARCIGPESVSEPSETATACRLATSEPCGGSEP